MATPTKPLPTAFPKTGSPETERPWGDLTTMDVEADERTTTPVWEDPLDPAVIAKRVAAEYAELDPRDQIMTDAYRMAWAAKRGAAIAIEASRQLGESNG